VTFDLDLEHTLDAGLPGDHRVQVWSRSGAGHLSARRSDFAQKFADGRTDRQTDDGRLAIALAHSWNELKTVQNYFCQNFVKFPPTVNSLSLA